MRGFLLSLLVLLAPLVGARAQVSYWFGQFQKQGNAELAQRFFATNGPGIAFSFDGLHWVISATGGGGGGGTNNNFATNALYSLWATNWAGSNALYQLLASNTNALYAGTATNWLGSNALYVLLKNGTNAATTNWLGLAQSNAYAGSFTGNGFGLTNLPPSGGGTSNVVFSDDGSVNYAGGGTASTVATNSVAIGYGASVANPRGVGVGVGIVAAGNDGVAVGFQAYGDSKGVAIGSGANAHNGGVAVGYKALAYTGGTDFYGVAIGENAIAVGDGNVAIGGQGTNVGVACVPGYCRNTVELGPGTNGNNGTLAFLGNPIVNSSGVLVASGGAQYKGLATLASGTFTVPNASVSATSVIELTYFSIDGNAAFVQVYNIVPGVSFDIRSSNGADVNKVAWAIINP